MVNKLFGYINLVTGIVFTMLAAPIALLLIIIILPFAVLAGAMREVRELLSEYPDCTVRMMQHGFKIANNGLKKVREPIGGNGKCATK